MKKHSVLAQNLFFTLFVFALGAVFFLFVLAVYHPFASGRTTKLSATKDESFLTYKLIHPLHEVEATSKDVDCMIDYNDATKTIQSTTFSADVSSFDSGNSNRDSHAMEVLDALTYPTVSFQSKSITTSGMNLTVSGDLTFHGQTKPVDFIATTSSGNNKLTVQGAANVSLTAFGIDRPSLMMIPVQDTLRISFTMVFPVSSK